jgi:hypothetical protein
MDAFLDSVSQQPHATRSGSCALPILYRDASQLGVFFRVDLHRAAALIGKDRRIEPWPILGKAVCAIVAAFRTDGFRARLPAGVDLGPARRD